MSLDVYLTKTVPRIVFACNITHNLNAMAEEAGIYKHLWHPESIGMTKALDLIVPLTKAIELMEENPVRFRKFNPSNGWGNYENLLEFLKQYRAACHQNPDADISVSR